MAMLHGILWHLYRGALKLLYLLSYREPSMHHYMDPQHLWWQNFCRLQPRTMNSLPSRLRRVDLSYSRFWLLLKTFLFGHWVHSTMWNILTVRSRNSLTYLLTVMSGIGVICNCYGMLYMIGSSTVPWYAACAVHSNYHWPCIVPTQAGVFQVHLPDSPCVCCPHMDVLWTACYH